VQAVWRKDWPGSHRLFLSPRMAQTLISLRQEPLILPDGTQKSAGRCINCHSGPEFTDAAVRNILDPMKTETRNREG
jgi:hypothetical protein